jgi:hypothetical protein
LSKSANPRITELMDMVKKEADEKKKEDDKKEESLSEEDMEILVRGPDMNSE